MHIYGMGMRLDHESMLSEQFRYRGKPIRDQDDIGVERVNWLDIATDSQIVDQAIGAE